MRKLNQRRPKAVPIPRPPTPPHSVQIQTLKQILCSKNNKSSGRNSQTRSETASWTSEASSSRLMSSAVDDEPADAIEPSPEFPAPPADFLEDIRAFRKQEEIECPLPSPLLHPHVHSVPPVFRLPHHVHGSARNDSSFNGNGSLNSSITETEESSCSPSVSPTASPLPSPHSSIDTSSTSSFAMHHETQIGETRFFFPPTQPLQVQPCHRNAGKNAQQRLVSGPTAVSDSATRLVTLTPLHSASAFEREPLYQRVAGVVPSGYGSLPRHSSASSSLVRPPDYRTAMHRLSLSKSAQTANQKAAVATHVVKPMQPLKAMSQSSLSSASLPVRISQLVLAPTAPSSQSRRSSISCGEVGRGEQTALVAPLNSRPLRKVKKRVSFSDQVELVAHSEDMNAEEHLPNPVLERVLGKAFMHSKNIQNG